MLLNVHSNYSLRYGTLSIQQLVDGLVTRGYDTAVLTDINNSTGSLIFIKACQEAGIRGLAGLEFRNRDELLYICIAKNENGFKELNEFQTYANKHKTLHPEMAPAFEQVQVIYPYGRKFSRKLFAHEFIGIRHIHLNKIRLMPSEARSKFVIWQPVTFTSGDGYKLHTQLRAINHNILISQLKEGQYADKAEVFPSKKNTVGKISGFPQYYSKYGTTTQRMFLYF
ncbi:DNA polymerase-3 subunit alpha [Mucilaginibacter pineti]|uniref:DNA polymerase-3 subunit alpha n=1 Tax=Mucilaginibacter pineti TaxID=1391627 RepID=A0A1G7GG00_9SPHI|nr:PHP domain-containing protein [Mucilaginibacter pineti]SDE87036.1 DNA polymerase-3 subunit alpha [Mucilaginibacter pineti]